MRAGPPCSGASGLSSYFNGDEGLAVDNVCEGNVGGIAAVTISRDEHGFAIQVNVFEKRIETDAFPFHVEMRPLGNAGNIHHIFLHGKFE